MIRSVGKTFLMVVALATGLLAADPPTQVIGETNPFAALTGNQFHGTWTGSALGPTPNVITFERSGTFVSQSGFQQGGYSLEDVRFSVVQGSWRRSGPREIEFVGLRYIFSSDGKMVSAERIIGALAFGEDFDSLNGAVTLEEVFCTDVPVGPPFGELPSCPDLRTAPADVIRGPIPVSLQRLRFGSVGP